MPVRILLNTIPVMCGCCISAVEWLSPKEGERNVKIKFDTERKKLLVTDRGGRKPLRMIDLRYVKEKVNSRVSNDGEENLMSVRVPGEIDLVNSFFFLF